MIIGIDLDDVLADFFPIFLAFCNEEYNEQFCMEDFVHYQFAEIMGITREESLARLTRFDNSEAKKNILPMLGAQKTITRLLQRHELHIVTARPVEIAVGTREWIEQHLLPVPLK